MTFLTSLIRFGLVAVALCVAALAMLAWLGFAVPALDLLNHAQAFLFPGSILAVLALLVLLPGRRRWMAVAFAALGAVASGSVMVPEIVAGAQARPPIEGRGTVRMMTHNLFGKNYEIAEVGAAILAEDPDIIVLQEYFGEQATELHPLLVQRYPYFVRCRGGKRANLGLYSRLPFAQVEDGACPDNAYGTTRTAHILAEFTTPDGKPFSVMTTHMDRPIPIARQNEQLSALSAKVDNIDGPLILAGDFNSTPWSYALRNFVASNSLVRQTLNLATYPMNWFYFGAWRDTLPFLPLDHVMTRGLTVHELHAGRPTASDHLPVVFTFSVD